jgi:hypothetical protein
MINTSLHFANTDSPEELANYLLTALVRPNAAPVSHLLVHWNGIERVDRCPLAGLEGLHVTRPRLANYGYSRHNVERMDLTLHGNIGGDVVLVKGKAPRSIRAIMLAHPFVIAATVLDRHVVLWFDAMPKHESWFFLRLATDLADALDVHEGLK